MRLLTTISLISLSLFLLACGGSQSKIDQIKAQQVKKDPEPKSLAEAEENWENTHGVGPVKSFELPAEIDADLVAQGQEVYESMCTACHKAEKRFIGPATQRHY